MDVDGLLFLGAFIGALVGWIILVKRSFRQNILLGFATIVFWPITVFVLIKNWGLKDKDIKVPFFTGYLRNPNCLCIWCSCPLYR